MAIQASTPDHGLWHKTHLKGRRIEEDMDDVEAFWRRDGGEGDGDGDARKGVNELDGDEYEGYGNNARDL